MKPFTKKSWGLLSLSVALLASGQAFATNYFSAVTALTHSDFVDGTKWTTACGSAAGSGTITLGATDTFTICTGHTLTVGAAYTLATVASAAAITVNSGGTLVATSTNKLTLTSGAGIVNNGTITLTNTDNLAINLSGSGTYTGTGVLNSTCTAVAAAAWTAATTWGTAAVDRCGVTVGGGTAPLPSAGSDVVIGAFAVTAGTGTVKSLTLNGASGGLTNSGTMTVTGNVAMSSAAALAIGANPLIVGGNLGIAGTAALSGTGLITLTGNLTTAATGSITGGPALTLTNAAHVLTLGGNLTVGALSLATITTSAKIITLPTATNTITASSLSGFRTCSSTASPVVATGALVSPIASTNGGTGYSCAVPVPVSASVDLRETGKVTTTSEEIKIK